MEAPVCSICGTKHFGANHVWKNAPLTEQNITAALSQVKEPISIKPTVATIEKPKFDRVAYQREYMRKRRAKK